MKRKLSILLLAAMFTASVGANSAMAAVEPNDNVSTTAKGKDNMHPPSILPPQV
ncbi:MULTISPECIES: hypothetical protein [Sporosarcina]|uniref:Uncharacterized protein n=1 Tax=Sporosarcina contaminans TaxID=633403 RepID=A0ABW3TXX3_9BACL